MFKVNAVRIVDENQEIACAICMESKRHLCILPCCHKAQSSVQFCTLCIEELCSRSAIDTFACPTCRSYVRLEHGKLAIKNNVGTCTICRSVNYMANSNPQMCHSCLQRRSILSHLRYECEQCHGLQHIPRPMWRYQMTTSSFTRPADWTCHQGCGTRTHWRLLEEDVHLVPEEDRPSSWNTPANKFYELIEAIDTAKTKNNERWAGFWSCMYLTACVAGAAIVLDKTVSTLSLLRTWLSHITTFRISTRKRLFGILAELYMQSIFTSYLYFSTTTIIRSIGLLHLFICSSFINNLQPTKYTYLFEKENKD
jgi:hypothetical protein